MYIPSHEKAIRQPTKLDADNGANVNSLCGDFLLLRCKFKQTLDGSNSIGSHQNGSVVPRVRKAPCLRLAVLFFNG
jgi:hypothetical protein